MSSKKSKNTIAGRAEIINPRLIMGRDDLLTEIKLNAHKNLYELPPMWITNMLSHTYRILLQEEKIKLEKIELEKTKDGKTK